MAETGYTVTLNLASVPNLYVLSQEAVPDGAETEINFHFDSLVFAIHYMGNTFEEVQRAFDVTLGRLTKRQLKITSMIKEKRDLFLKFIFDLTVKARSFEDGTGRTDNIFVGIRTIYRQFRELPNPIH